MNKLDELAENCVILLNKILTLYSNSQISTEQFYKNTNLKVRFLIDNVEKLQDAELRFNCYKTLNLYANHLKKQGENNSIYNIPK